MNKPTALRDHLLAAVPGLRRNRDQLSVFVDQGNIRCTAAHGLSFEYGYTVELLLTNYPGSADAVAIPLLAWLREHQRELLENLERGKDAIQFQVEILNNDLIDMSIRLPLTERVIVKPATDGSGILQINYPEEPQLTEQLPAGPWQLYAGYELVAEWTSTAPTGSELETPHPQETGCSGCQ
ncbi:P2 phage tail completion protein R (GpR) [compost metagenome]